MKKTTIIVLSIIVLSFLISGYLYPSMPDKIASHWNANGDVDGYMNKFWGMYMMPIVMLVLLGLFLLIPRIDPLKKNIMKFENYYNGFILMISFFLFYMYLLTIAWNLGYVFNMTIMFLPAFAILFYYIGIMTENAKQNWFIGIRTPWTLSDKNVWNKTNKLAGRMFKLCAVIAVFGLLFKDYIILFVLIPVLFTAIFVIVYSYFIYPRK